MRGKEGNQTMARALTVGEDTTHLVDDPRCPDCWEEYPARCECGGLIHAAGSQDDGEGGECPLTRCDRCGRSEKEID